MVNLNIKQQNTPMQQRDPILEMSFLLSQSNSDSNMFFPQDNFYIKRTLPHIKNALMQKNAKYLSPERVRMKARYLIEQQDKELVKLTEEYDRLSKKKAVESQTMLLFDKKLTIDSISDYIDCKIDQSNVHTITQLMSSSEINKKFKDYLLRGKQKEGRKTQRSKIQYSAIKHSDRTQKTAYHKIVSSMLKQSHSKNDISDFLLRLYSIRANQIWKVLIEQFDGFHKNEKDGLQTIVVRNTLKILSRKFAKRIPNIQQCILDFFYTNLYRIGMPIYTNKRKLPIWGLCYMMLRAGNIQQTISILGKQCDFTCHTLLKDLSDFKQHGSGKKNYQWPHSDCSDVYLQQIYNILNRKPFSDPFLIEQVPNFIWFSLQTCCLDPSVKDCQYNITQLQSYVLKRFYQDGDSAEIIWAILYSLNYRGFDELQSRFVNQDEKMHLDIAMYMVSENKKNDVYKFDLDTYTEKIRSYAIQSLIYGLDVSINYLSLSPTSLAFFDGLDELLFKHDRLQQFFCLRNPVQTDSPFVKYRYIWARHNQFQKYVQKVVNQLKKSNVSYFKGIKIIHKYLNNAVQVTDSLVSLNLESIIGQTFPQKDVQESCQILSKLQHRMPPKYFNLFQFIREYQRFECVIKGQDPIEVLSAFSQSIFFPMNNKPITSALQDVLASLEERNKMQAYYEFIKIVLKNNKKLKRRTDISDQQHKQRYNEIKITFLKIQEKGFENVYAQYTQKKEFREFYSQSQQSENWK